MLSGLIKALFQLFEPNFNKVLRRGLLVSLGVFAALIVVLNVGLGLVSVTEIGWLDTMVDVLGGFAIFFVGLLLFPGLIGIVMSFFLDAAAAAVEAKHYPELPPAQGQSVREATLSSLKFSTFTLAVNLVVLPLYALLIFFPPFSLVLFYGVNGVVMGREYYETVALRRLTDAQAGTLRRRNRGKLFVVGAVTAFLFTIPIVNLVAPLIATAWMVHLVMRATGGRPGEAPAG